MRFYIENQMPEIANSTNISDMKNAAIVMKYARENDFDDSQGAAMCVRAGVRLGNAFGRRKAGEAYKLLHDYQGREDKKHIPAERIKKAAEWIRDPDELKELAAFLEGRAAVITSGMAIFPDDDYTPRDGEAAAWSGNTDNDVNSDGTEEV